jgi:hypothetical protein
MPSLILRTPFGVRFFFPDKRADVGIDLGLGL